MPERIVFERVTGTLFSTSASPKLFAEMMWPPRPIVTLSPGILAFARSRSTTPSTLANVACEGCRAWWKLPEMTSVAAIMRIRGGISPPLFVLAGPHPRSLAGAFRG